MILIIPKDDYVSDLIISQMQPRDVMQPALYVPICAASYTFSGMLILLYTWGAYIMTVSL